MKRYFIILFAVALLFVVFRCKTSDKEKKIIISPGTLENKNIEESNKKSDILPDSFYILSEDWKIIKTVKYKNSISTEVWGIINGYPTDDTIVGNFDKDLTLEKAWFEEIIKKKKVDGYVNYERTGNSMLCFSDKSIKPLIFKNWTDCKVIKNEGDLDNDGIDEIGLQEPSPASGCENYYVCSNVANRWIIKKSIPNTVNMRQAGVIMVYKDINKKGNIIIRIPLLFYDDQKNPIPNEFYPVGCNWSNVVELSVKF